MNTPLWKQRYQAEIEKAESARMAGNEGMARVCARRAAGITMGEYLSRQGITLPARSAYDLLRFSMQQPSLPQPVRDVLAHFLVRITTEHTLPMEADLVGEARWLAETLLGLESPRE